MGILEYLFEKNNPGKVGNVQKNKQSIEHVSIPLLLFKLFVSTFIVYILFYITVLQNYNYIYTPIFIIIIFAYCLLSYKFIPRPDKSNLGLFGGMIDHPFRYTDDLNRMLIVLLVLMYPGRFISITVIQTLMIVKRT